MYMRSLGGTRGLIFFYTTVYLASSVKNRYRVGYCVPLVFKFDVPNILHYSLKQRKKVGSKNFFLILRH